MIDISRLIFKPTVKKFGNSIFNFDNFLDGIDEIGFTEAAETSGTPLADMVARIGRDGQEHGGNGDDMAEYAGRQCYRSFSKGRGQAEYISNIVDMEHGSVFEHASINYQLAGVSRSFSLELIRHRAGTGYSQESQRYVPADDINFVVPPLLITAIEREVSNYYDMTTEYLISNLSSETALVFKVWIKSCLDALEAYTAMLPGLKAMAIENTRNNLTGEKALTSAQKRALEAARSVLPNAAETRMVFTCNLRQLRHIQTLRGSEAADLEIRRFAVALLEESRDYAPHYFADMQQETGTDGLPTVKSGKARI